MGLAAFVLRRLGLAVFVLLGVLLITFTLAHSISSDPLVALLGRGAAMRPELAAAYREKFHLNDPLIVQFYYYLFGILQGDMGFSLLRGKPVAQAIGEALPFTLQVTFFALLMILVGGIPLGVLAGRYHHRLVDYGIRALYLTSTSLPIFFIALFLLVALTFNLGLLPSGHPLSPGVAPPKPITNFQILDSLLEGNLRTFGDALVHVLMPSAALALAFYGYITKVLRASILEVMRANYIRTARAKGVAETAVFFRHGLRNAMVPVVTLAAVMVTWLLSGAIFVETIFAYPGIGQYTVEALAHLDYPSILGITLVFAIIIVLSNLAADILYAVVNPEIRLK